MIEFCIGKPAIPLAIAKGGPGLQVGEGGGNVRQLEHFETSRMNQQILHWPHLDIQKFNDHFYTVIAMFKFEYFHMMHETVYQT